MFHCSKMSVRLLRAWRRLKAAITLRRYSSRLETPQSDPVLALTGVSSPDEYPFGNSCRTCEQFSGTRWFDTAALTASPSSGCRYCIFVVNVLNHFYELNKSIIINMYQYWHAIEYRDQGQHYTELELYTPVGRSIYRLSCSKGLSLMRSI